VAKRPSFRSKKKKTDVKDRPPLDRKKRGRFSDKKPKPARAEETSNAIVVGLVQKAKFGWALIPSNRRNKNDYFLKNAALAEKFDGHLVVAKTSANTKQGRIEAVIEKSIGTKDDPHNLSLIALHAHQVPTEFPDEVVKEAEAAKPVMLGDREDLRSVPLVTIDGEDARDFDDAVFAEKTDQNGWHLIVAIADVAHYVRPGSALDREAYRRGNSTYLPDRVVPMLPEALSNELCSLKPNVERACMAAHIWIDEEGEITRWRFTRGLMKSHARLTYEQVQNALDGNPDGTIAPLFEPIIKPLYEAYRCLMRARVKRGTLELDLPERKVLLNKDGTVKAIVRRQQMDSHKLIEEFMIAANVAAAAQLENKGGVCLYRIHDKPTEIKQEVLREFLESLDISLIAGKQLHPRMLTHILENAAGKPHAQVVNEMILRTQSQAVYSPENVGHFGLALAKYAHFTSPIRRYADLVVHRGLIRINKLGDDGLSDEQQKKLKETGEHISDTERRSVTVEREVVDRYTSLFLADKIETIFPARISGVSRYGLFVRLDETGADGIVPFKVLPHDYYQLDEKRQALVGQRTGRIFQIGMPVKAQLDNADPLTGAMAFKIIEDSKPDKTQKKHARAKAHRN
jgi:ribonuclease R